MWIDFSEAVSGGGAVANGQAQELYRRIYGYLALSGALLLGSQFGGHGRYPGREGGARSANSLSVRGACS